MRPTEPEGWLWSGDRESLWNDVAALYLKGEFQESGWKTVPQKCHGSG